MDNQAAIRDYLFLSAPDVATTFLVEASGRVRIHAEGTTLSLPGRRRQELPALFHVRDLLPGRCRRSWRRGWLPILDLANEHGQTLSLCCHQDRLWTKTSEGCREWPGGQEIPPGRWEMNTESIARAWNDWFQRGWILPPMHPLLDDAWRSALVQARSAFWGRHPKYGVENYAEYRADGFPPTIAAMCGTLNLFRHHREAQELAQYYLERFVEPDGTLDYYGTALSEYGEILQMTAELAEAPGGDEWLRRRLPVVAAVLRHVYDLFNPWKHPCPASGLCCGPPEADTREDAGAYLHNNLQILRGMIQITPRLRHLGVPEMSMEAENFTGLLRTRIDRVLEDCRGGFSFLPYRLEQREDIRSFTDTMDHAYANYRYYPEMLATGLLPPQDSLKIIRAREELGGIRDGLTVLAWPGGVPGFDHWPMHHDARALLELDDRPRFMDRLFAHLLRYQSRDTYTAYESITCDGTGEARSDWCVPAQLVLPRMLAWSLQYRTWDGRRRDWGGPSPEEIGRFLD